MKIAITGSSGMVGSVLRARLEAGGHEVVRLRHGDASSPDAEWSPTDQWIRDGVLDGVDAVAHLAAPRSAIAAGARPTRMSCAPAGSMAPGCSSRRFAG